jgi:hypothetical protein
LALRDEPTIFPAEGKCPLDCRGMAAFLKWVGSKAAVEKQV